MEMILGLLSKELLVALGVLITGVLAILGVKLKVNSAEKRGEKRGAVIERTRIEQETNEQIKRIEDQADEIEKRVADSTNSLESLRDRLRKSSTDYRNK